MIRIMKKTIKKKNVSTTILKILLRLNTCTIKIPRKKSKNSTVPIEDYSKSNSDSEVSFLKVITSKEIIDTSLIQDSNKSSMIETDQVEKDFIPI